MKKTEKRIFLGILCFSLMLWGFFLFSRSQNYDTITIQKDGVLLGTYSLSQDQVIAIGDTNICEIKDGTLTMIFAACPDQLCMQQGPIDSSGGMIVCLPNKITIEGKAETSPSDLPDAISG